jgi:hypothetical protein
MKKTFSLSITCMALLLTVLSLNPQVRAQEAEDIETQKKPNKGIVAVRLMFGPGMTSPSVAGIISVRVFMTDPVNLDDVKKEKVKIRFVKSNRDIPPDLITLRLAPAGFGNTEFQYLLTVNPAATPAPNDDEIEVKYESLRVTPLGSTNTITVSPAVSVGKIYNASNIDGLLSDIRAELQKSVAASKTSDEKLIFAGLNISVPSGGGNTEGNADFYFNKTLYGSDIKNAGLFDKLDFGLHIKKGSEDKADPRHFDLGFTLRKIFLRDKEQIQKVRDALVAPDPDKVEAVKALNKLQQKFFRGLFFDNALRFEGDIKGTSIGNVSNLLYDSQLQVATVARPLSGETSFWYFRLIPIGLEAGYNLTNSEDMNQEKHSLVRVKSGATLNLHYQAINTEDPIGRIELELQGVNRYLFQRESALDEMTKKVVLTDKGNKYWVEGNFKVMTGLGFGKQKVGFRVNFSRGSLPPVYAFNKAFKFGLVFESFEDTEEK